jgi:hypothetical protein
MANASAKGADIRLAVIAGTSVFISLAAFAAGFTGRLPAGISTVVALVGVSIGLRVAWSYAAKSASSASHARTNERFILVTLMLYRFSPAIPPASRANIANASGC